MEKALTLALTSVEHISDGFFARLPNIIIAICALLIFVVVARGTRKLVMGLGHRAHLDETLGLALGTLTTFTMNMLGLLVAATIVFPSFSPGNLVAGLGITSVAVGFAFKDILQNFFAGILLLWQKPFAIGDHIRTQSFEGMVVDIDIRSTRIKSPDDEMVVMPNGVMISSPIVVLTGYEHRRVKMTVPVASASSIEDARRAIVTVLNDSSLVAKDPAPAVYRTSADTTNATLDVYFWTGSAPEKLQQATDEVAAALEPVFKAKPETKEIEGGCANQS